MATYETRDDEAAPPSRPRRERAGGVVELVREAIEDVAAEAERALGSEEGLERVRAEVDDDGADDGDDGDDGDDFFEGVARAIERTLWDDGGGKSGGEADEPGERGGGPDEQARAEANPKGGAGAGAGAAKGAAPV